MPLEKRWSEYKQRALVGLPDGISREDALFLVELAFYGGAAAALADVRFSGIGKTAKDIDAVMVRVGKIAAAKMKGAH